MKRILVVLYFAALFADDRPLLRVSVQDVKNRPTFVGEEPFLVSPKAGQVPLGESITFDALAGNTGQGLRLTRVTQPIHGGYVVADRLNNTFTYRAPSEERLRISLPTQELSQEPCPPEVPTPDQLFTDSFTYELTDENNETMMAAVTVRVTCGEEFIVTPKSGQAAPELCIVFDAREGNSGCLLQLLSVTQPVLGKVLADRENNVFTYQAPKKIFSGKTVFAYTMIDVTGVPATQTVTVSLATPF